MCDGYLFQVEFSDLNFIRLNVHDELIENSNVGFDVLIAYCFRELNTK